MLVYFSFYFLAIGSYFAYRSVIDPRRVYFLLVSFLSVWLFAGLRGSVGQDRLNYSLHFERLVSWTDRVDYFSYIEPFFAVIMVLFSIFFDSSVSVFLFLSFLQTILLFQISYRMHHGVIFFASYIIVFYVSLNFNVIRAGLALLLFLQALVFCKEKKGAFYLLLALATHVSVGALLPLYLLRARLSFGSSIIIVVFCAIAGVFAWIAMGDYLVFKYTVYVLEADAEVSVPGTMVILIVTGFIVLIFERRVPFEVLFAYFLMSFWMILTTKFSVFHRFYQMAFLVFLFFVFEKRVFNLYSLRVRLSSLYTVLLVAYFSLMTAAGMLSEVQRIYDSGKGDVEYASLPYSFFWSDD